MSDEAGRHAFHRSRWGFIAALGCAGVAAFTAACDAPNPGDGSGLPPPPPLPTFASLLPIKPAKKGPPELKDLGPSGRRVKVIVLPGSAAVEIDGIAARRRDGVVEIVGLVGEQHRLRVMDDLRQIELNVTIGESGASPSLVDLSVAAAAGAPR